MDDTYNVIRHDYISCVVYIFHYTLNDHDSRGSVLFVLSVDTFVKRSINNNLKYAFKYTITIVIHDLIRHQ